MLPESRLLDGVHPRSRFRVVPDATHSLLSAERYNYQLPDQWPRSAQLRYILSGRDAFAGDVLDTTTRSMTDSTISVLWEQVHFQLKELKVTILHFDEAQDI